MPRTPIPRRELLASLIIAVVAFLPALVGMGHLFTQDWHYFNDLSWMVRSEIFHYGRLPLHEPWFCGGFDIVQNPQNRLLSPMGLLDLALPPQWANLGSLLIYAFLGAMGMFALLREELSISFETSVIIAGLFIGSSSFWFAPTFALDLPPGPKAFAWRARLAVAACSSHDFLRDGSRWRDLCVRL
jgi:hypothetical protein